MPRPRSQDVPVEVLYGGKAAAEGQALRGMEQLEAELAKSFEVQRSLDQRVAAQMRPLQEALGRQLGDGAQEAAKGLATLDAELGKGRRLTAPTARKEAARIFTGSIGATVTPPYNYQWTWNAQSGGAIANVAANRTNGQQSFFLWNNSRDATGWGRTAVGIYFRPVVANGILRIWSNPSFNYNWWTVCAFASAHSDAFIGLYVGRYTLTGGFDGAPVSQMSYLWNDDSWWSGASGSGSNSGYPLFAQLNVDSAHWYAIWVWAGGRATGAGWGTFSGSGAGSSLAATVPSITWELF